MPGKFLTNTDHSKVDEKKFNDVEEVSKIKPDDTGKLDTTLMPGHYVLFRNLKDHFKGRIYAELTVTYQPHYPGESGGTPIFIPAGARGWGPQSTT